MTIRPLRLFLCNGASLPDNVPSDADVQVLEYRAIPGVKPNVKISLPDFVRGVFHLPERFLDLLELASYVFAADRMVPRGEKDAVIYDAWARRFSFVVKVRDAGFWNEVAASGELSDGLRFVSGDRDHTFQFQPGHSTPPTGLFDREEFKIDPGPRARVALFSGGLDSLAGVVELLETTSYDVYLISHRSGLPATARTQDGLVKALDDLYPGRVRHYKFHSGLVGLRASEETQRTRGFLFMSIAVSLAYALSQSSFLVFENGVTSMNFLRRQDLMNARASRTTHPKTLGLFQRLFEKMLGSTFTIDMPYLWRTKSDVFECFKKFGRERLVPSSVSCSRVFKSPTGATHCGECFQCIDRRLAAYASALEKWDDSTGTYAMDVIRKKITNRETKTILIDYVRQARNFSVWNENEFYREMLDELATIQDFVPAETDEAFVDEVWSLCKRHGNQVLAAIRRMRALCDNPYEPLDVGSFLEIVASRGYLKNPVEDLIEAVCNRLRTGIPIAFQTYRPKNENGFNDTVSALLGTEQARFEREHPAVKFALAHSIPDHSSAEADLFIESKYIRASTSPSKATEGMAADLIKYPSDVHVLFIVYDPDRGIPSDTEFISDFQSKGRNTVCIVR